MRKEREMVVVVVQGGVTSKTSWFGFVCQLWLISGLDQLPVVAGISTPLLSLPQNVGIDWRATSRPAMAGKLHGRHNYGVLRCQ